jgi:hypothetical protein
MDKSKSKGIPVTCRVRRRDPHIFWTIGSQMAVMSALRADRSLSPGRSLVLISVRA